MKFSVFVCFSIIIERFKLHWNRIKPYTLGFINLILKNTLKKNPGIKKMRKGK